MNNNHNSESNQEGFSIIIPVYNGENTLPDTLRSVSGLDFDHYELIVVDDGSTDDSASIARSHGAKVVCLGDNAGPANARNQGAKHASYDKLLFTDSDVLVPKKLLQQLDDQFRSSKADAVQGTFSEVCPFANYFSQYKNLYNRFALNQLPDWIDTTFTSITAVRRQAFLDCGGFDANILTASVEDRTLGRNLMQSNFRIRLDRSLQVIHNKKLTFSGFIRNQFRRSRDLAKLLLRNRCEPESELPDTTALSSGDESGRFGTNSLATMIRIPFAYSILGLLLVAPFASVFGIMAALFFLAFLALIWRFEKELVLRRGIKFALWGILVNFMDALVSGVGVGLGMVEFICFRRIY
jgi:glycosyltransferase involved in cell wall biosynthesis